MVSQFHSAGCTYLKFLPTLSYTCAWLLDSDSALVSQHDQTFHVIQVTD